MSTASVFFNGFEPLVGHSWSVADNNLKKLKLQQVIAAIYHVQSTS